jgi:DNA/RNA endonuclease YhcR with UshA esterase domain
MKPLFTTILFFLCFRSFAQTKISIDSVNNHKGELVTVCAKVYGTKFLDKSQITFIDLGAHYPDAPLTVVILAKDRANFPQSPETLYADKQICVTGVIKEYKGKLEIDVESPKGIAME